MLLGLTLWIAAVIFVVGGLVSALQYRLVRSTLFIIIAMVLGLVSSDHLG